MRFRKLAGLVVGALTVGALAGPGLVAPAHAAGETVGKFVSSSCKYGGFAADYRSDYDVTVDGTAVSVTFDAPFNPGASNPSFNGITFTSVKPTLVLDIGGQSVSVTGTQTYNPPAAGNSDMTLPTLTGTLAAPAASSAVSLTSMKFDIVINYGPGTMNCTQDTVSTLDTTCTFGSFKIFYPVEVYTRASTTNVSSYFRYPFVPGMPAFLQVSGQTPTLKLDVDGEDVTLTGTATYSPTKPGNTEMPLPVVTGTRTATTAISAVTVEDFDTSLTVSGGANPIACATYVPTENTSTNTGANALTCIYSTFPGMSYDSTVVTTYDHKDVSALLADVTFGIIPSSFELRSVQVAASLKAGTTTVDLASPVKSYSSPYPAANATITDLPELTGTTSSVQIPAATTVDLITFNLMIKGFGPNPAAAVVKCGLAATTVTTVTATSTAANQVGLSAAIDKTAAAGTVTFYEGGTKVGDTATVAGGVATTALSNVPAGAHSYTATFTPTEAFRFKASTSAASAVTVAPAATATTLTATSAAPNTASLAATVSPSTAGTIEFFEGATKVGETAAAAGAGSLALTGVAAGAHTYTARFTPTDATKFGVSTSAPATVTVAAPVPSGPSAACVQATGKVTTATAAVKAATTKVTKDKASTKKAQAKVTKAAKAAKKAKGKAAKAKAAKALKAAKAALKKAQAKQKADTKKLDTAKKALTAANNAVKAAC